MNAAIGFLVDTAIMAIAYVAAFLLRFDFHAPGWGWARVWTSFITVWSVQLAVLIAFDCDCGIIAKRTREDLETPQTNPHFPYAGEVNGGTSVRPSRQSRTAASRAFMFASRPKPAGV